MLFHAMDISIGKYVDKLWNFLQKIMLSYSQPRSRVNDIFEIWTEFWNLHVSFQNRQRDFRVPV